LRKIFPQADNDKNFLFFSLNPIHSISTLELKYSSIRIQIFPRKSALTDFSLAKHLHFKKFSEKLKLKISISKNTKTKKLN